MTTISFCTKTTADSILGKTQVYKEIVVDLIERTLLLNVDSQITEIDSTIGSDEKNILSSGFSN